MPSWLILDCKLKNKYIQSVGLSASVLSIQAEVVLGSPAKQCAGFGICKIFPIWYQIHSNCCHLKTIINLLPNGDLQCVFSVSEWSEPVRQKYFSGAYFQVETPCWLPLWLHKQLGLQVRRAIAPGHYSIQKIEGSIIVVFWMMQRSLSRFTLFSSICV